jgi:hypothetical protein
MCINGMWPWKVPKWPWFWAEVAVKAWRDLATLLLTVCHEKSEASPLVARRYFVSYFVTCKSYVTSGGRD